LREAAAAIGRQPGDYSSKPKIPLDARQPAVDAMRSILQHLIDTIEVNVAGVIDDVDVEFLHDLRVATRRTRSALSQVKGVLPADATSPFGDEFRWLGSVTGPLRDLDVYLLEMDGFRRQLDVTDGTLEPLQRLLERSRRNELRRVRRALRSARFARLICEWNAFLKAPMLPDERAPNADRAIAEVAGERILKAYRRMVKKGSKLGDDPPAESLHRLRIDAKKLRYLLEFFYSLYDQAAVTRLVKELKRLQDILGGFNDMEVQQHRLHEFGDLMIEASSAGSETLFAMGRLADAMGERQEAYRQQFHERFEAFANDDSRGLYRKIFGGRTA
jgi:CHAD domain-containing protein